MKGVRRNMNLNTVFAKRIDYNLSKSQQHHCINTIKHNQSLAFRLTAKRLFIFGLFISFFIKMPFTTASSVSSVAQYNDINAVSNGDLKVATPKNITNQLIITVRETSGVDRINEIVRSGVPLPQELNVRSTNKLTVVDANNTHVPSEFQVLARWNSGRNETSAPIQWLLITFPATVSANESATYRLVTDGSAGKNPNPPVPVTIIRNGNQVTVNTGVATFVLGGNPDALFDEISSAEGKTLVNGGSLTAVANGMNLSHSVIRNVRIEHAGPLTAIIIIDGEYGGFSLGGGVISSLRRYIFTAGSPTAIVRQAINWEGDLCAWNGWDLTCNENVNGVLLTRVRNELALNMPGKLTVTTVGDFESPGLKGKMNHRKQKAFVRQKLRKSRTEPLAFDMEASDKITATGGKADGGILAASNASGTVAVALNHMRRYEPQALRLENIQTSLRVSSRNRINRFWRLMLDIADDSVWLGQRQGMFATFAVSALQAKPSRSELNRLVWAPLNHPLHAWPEPAWFASSEAVDEIPVGDLSANLTGYDTLVPGVLNETLQQIDEKGLSGLMTFGVYPRYWGYFLYADEIDCGVDEPTPNESWDNTYWCSTWTDYHNTIATAPIWAMRSRDVDWLDEIAFPGALRMLHTQINQCSPEDQWFYCGQSPAGYQGYRSDFNSSHAYFDNLFLYYWLTGDYTVVETLKRGASTMRAYLCNKRPNQICLPDDPPTDEWAGLAGRVASQWFAAFRFVGLASDEASYLDDWQSGLARAVTQYYVEPEQNGVRYGFWLDDRVVGPGTYSTAQLWMSSLYDMNNLYRLQLDTNDAPIGNPPVRPSQVIAAWARTLVRFGATTAGDGTAGGKWPNALYFTWTGNRIGGALINVTANTTGDDHYLYNTGKSTLTAVLMRAANQTGDAALLQMGTDMTYFALAAAQSDFCPLNKLQGEYLARLHAAVARLNGNGN